MKPHLRTILSIGNNKKGFSFVEVMIALVILSTGIVMVYKSFFLCVDYLNNLTTRVYATHLIDSRIAEITRSFSTSLDGAVDLGPLSETIPINRRRVTYDFAMQLTPLDGGDLYQLAIDLNWRDGPRRMHEARVAFLTR